jgi:nucleoside-diphosphate-sugar epimerase
MFLPAVQGKAAEGLGKIDLPHTYTFISDFGKALAVLGERDEALGQAWHVPSAEAVSTRRFIEMIFAELGQPPKISVMGKTMLRIGGIFIPGAREMVEMTYEFENPFVVDSSKFVRAFGDLATPLKEGIRQTVAWYKEFAAAQAK